MDSSGSRYPRRSSARKPKYNVDKSDSEDEESFPAEAPKSPDPDEDGEYIDDDEDFPNGEVVAGEEAVAHEEEVTDEAPESPETPTPAPRSGRTEESKLSNQPSKKTNKKTTPDAQSARKPVRRVLFPTAPRRGPMPRQVPVPPQPASAATRPTLSKRYVPYKASMRPSGRGRARVGSGMCEEEEEEEDFPMPTRLLASELGPNPFVSAPSTFQQTGVQSIMPTMPRLPNPSPFSTVPSQSQAGGQPGRQNLNNWPTLPGTVPWGNVGLWNYNNRNGQVMFPGTGPGPTGNLYGGVPQVPSQHTSFTGYVPSQMVPSQMPSRMVPLQILPSQVLPSQMPAYAPNFSPYLSSAGYITSNSYVPSSVIDPSNPYAAWMRSMNAANNTEQNQNPLGPSTVNSVNSVSRVNSMADPSVGPGSGIASGIDSSPMSASPPVGMYQGGPAWPSSHAGGLGIGLVSPATQRVAFPAIMLARSMGQSTTAARNPALPTNPALPATNPALPGNPASPATNPATNPANPACQLPAGVSSSPFSASSPGTQPLPSSSPTPRSVLSPLRPVSTLPILPILPTMPTLPILPTMPALPALPTLPTATNPPSTVASPLATTAQEQPSGNHNNSETVNSNSAPDSSPFCFVAGLEDPFTDNFDCFDKSFFSDFSSPSHFPHTSKFSGQKEPLSAPRSEAQPKSHLEPQPQTELHPELHPQPHPVDQPEPEPAREDPPPPDSNMPLRFPYGRDANAAHQAGAPNNKNGNESRNSEIHQMVLNMKISQNDGENEPAQHSAGIDALSTLAHHDVDSDSTEIASFSGNNNNYDGEHASHVPSEAGDPESDKENGANDATSDGDDNSDDANSEDEDEEDGSDDEDFVIPHLPLVADADMYNTAINPIARYWLPQTFLQLATQADLEEAVLNPPARVTFALTAPRPEPIWPLAAQLPAFDTDPFLPFAPWRANQLVPFRREPGNRVIEIPARFLAAVGRLYPSALFAVSRHPASANTTVSVRGRDLVRSALLHGREGQQEADQEERFVLLLQQRDWPIGGVALLANDAAARAFVDQVQGAFGLLPGGQEVFLHVTSGVQGGSGVWVCRGYEGRRGSQDERLVRTWVAEAGRAAMEEEDRAARAVLVRMGEAAV